MIDFASSDKLEYSVGADLQEQFPECFEKLMELFGTQEVLNRINRLNEIYQVCERAWERNLDYLNNFHVKYLLIAEAPPWSNEGEEVSYFYQTLGGPWVGRVLKAFFENRPDNVESCLQELARRQFVLIDSLPFPMKYSTPLRRSPQYLSLVKSCSGYLMSKIQDDRINWADNVKVALAFKLNGLKLIEAYSNKNRIELPTGQKLNLNEDIIAADGSGFTNATKLKEIWGL